MKKIIIWLVVAFVAMEASPVTQAWECAYGTVNGWVKLEGDTEWREAPVEGVTLKVHEPFKVKLEVTTKTDCTVDMEIFDPGVTKVYEVIEGPSKNGEHILIYDCPDGWTKTYEWTIRPTGEFTEGMAPWKGEVEFITGIVDDCTAGGTFLYAYISPSEWQGSDGGAGDNGGTGDDGGGGIPGFESALLLISFLLFIGIIKRKRNP